MKRLTLITIITTLLLLGCVKEQPKPVIKTTLKDTKILVSQLSIARYSYTTYTYVIEGFNGQVDASGNESCAKTFTIEIGKSYNLQMEYNGDKVIPIEDLCELTARLKASQPM